MRKTCIFTILLCILGSSVFAYDVLVPANESCRTDILYPDTNRHDNSKLSVRSDASANKSWMKFDISGLENLETIRSVTLRVALHEDEALGTYTCDVSAVNDACLDNISWTQGDITWGNAPANDTADWYDPDFTKATLMGTITLVDPLAGDQFYVDVTSAIENDTDGTVQFILHNSTTLLQWATHDHSGGEAYYPTLIVTYPPLGADYPVPGVGEQVTSSLASLSWTNPEPNLPGAPITCDVYFGLDPNRPQMDMVPLGADVESVAINTTNFPTFGNLTGDPATKYYWFVDCHDTVKGLIEGEEWSFVVNDNTAPTVGAGTDQTIWLTSASTVTLSGSASDDGLPAAGTFTTTWAETAGPGTSVIDADDQLSTLVTFSERGDYTFTLTADDGELQTSDTVRVVVGDDTCDASHIESGDPYNPGDGNQDCVVDLADLQELIVNDWLNCTDDLMDCGF